jgi:radical SAM superfamily enzyme YgiQ (UPF0313 family)
MNICLATQHADSAFTPLALLYLKAHLVLRLGFAPDDVRVLEFAPSADAGTIAESILATGPDVLGLSCYVWNITTLTAACRLIAARRPSLKIVLGGPEVGPVAASVLDAHRAVMAVVRGEGELPFADLIGVWRAAPDAEPCAVHGIAYRSRGRIVETGDAPVLKDLNALASPHLTLAPDVDGRVVCLETQRGCVFRCNFCFYNKDLSIRNRRFDLARIKDELLVSLNRDAEAIYLMDPIFNLYADRAKEICRFIAAHNSRRIPIHAEVWAEFVDDELARLMREAHFGFVEVGLQSTDDTALATVDRRLRMQRFMDGVRCLKAYGLHWELQLIFGLPGETRESFRRSLNFAHAIDAPQLAVYPLMVLPGTELWRKASALRLDYDPQPPYVVRSHLSMSADDIAYGMRVVRALQDMGDSRAIRLLGRERGVSYCDVIDAWIAQKDDARALESTPYRIKQFVVEFCEARQIPSEFYRGFASWERAG